MWDDLLKAISYRDQDKALGIISTMTPDDFNIDYSRLITQQSPIHLGSLLGLTAVIEALLNKFPKLANATDHSDRTPLHEAASHASDNNLAVVKALLEASASVNAIDEKGDTPLNCAAFNSEEINLAVVKALLEAGASVDAADHNGNTALNRAAFNGNLAVVKVLLEAGASVDAINKKGDTPLHRATSLDHLSIVTALLEAGASVDATDKDGKTPLHRATSLDWAVLNNVADDNQYLDLSKARFGSNLAIMTALLEAGASVDAADHNGNTALHKAALLDDASAVKVLLEAGASVDAADHNGNTALHKAAFRDDASVVKVLLEASANPNFFIKSGKRVSNAIADKIKDPETIELLRDASAIHKIIASLPAFDQQEIRIEDKVEIKNLDLLRSILNHNFQLHNKAYKSKAELKHIFDLIQPNSAQQQVEIDKIKIQFNQASKVIESGIDYADQSKIADLQYLAAVSPLAQISKIISDKVTSDDRKEQELVETLYSQTLNIPEDYRSYVTQVLKLNAKMIKKIAQTHPKVAKDLFNIVTCTNEQRDQYQAKIAEVGYDAQEGISISSTANLKNETDTINSADIFSLFPQCNVAELFTATPSLEGHLSVSTDYNHDQVHVNGQITDHPMEGVS